MGAPRPEPISRRLFRRLLCLFPGAFRARYGAEILAAFDHEQAGLSAAGPLRRSLRTAATLADLTRCALVERASALAAWPAWRGQGGGTALQAGRFAIRNARRSPGFTLAVVATLGLGIGATTMMYGVADRLLLRPPEGLARPDRLVRIYFDRVSIFTHLHQVDRSFTYPDLLDFAEASTLKGIAGYTNTEMTLGWGADAERIRTQLAQAALFDVLEVRPELGRFYTAEEDRIAGGSDVVVLSDAFWTRRFGRDPGALGRSLRIGPADYTVIGVAPRGFTGAVIEAVDVWIPMLTTQAAEVGDAWSRSRSWYWFEAVARLRDGVSREAAEAEATAAHRAGHEKQIAAGRYDPDARVVLASVVPGSAPDARAEVAVSRWLTGVAVLVMLIACANVANLLLLRAVRRRREMAIRVALGIGRGALFTQLLAESALLAAAAATAAVLVARWGGALVYRLLLPDLEPGAVLGSPRLLGFAALAAALAAVLTGVVPSALASRPDVVGDLKEAGRGRSSHRLRAALVVLQVALSVVLLSGAGVFLRSLDRVHRLDLGFSADGVIVASAESADGFHGDEAAGIVTAAMERLQGAGVVEAAAVTTLPPLSGWYGLSLAREDGDSIQVPQGPYYYTVSPDYFRTMGMHVVRGRGFAAGDTVAGAPPVMLLAEDLAGRIFGAADPLGACLRVEQGGEQPPCTRIVGIVADHRSRGLVEALSPIFYLPVGHPAASPPQVLVVRVSGDVRASLPLVHRAVAEAAPGVRYVSVRPLSTRIDELSRSWRLGATLLVVFGLLALAVAALGLHAVVAFEIAQRHGEFGIRSALGAERPRIVGMIFRSVLARVSVGVGLGLGIVAALSGRARDLLFRTSPTDPLVLGVAAGTLVLVALLAAVRPAMRAAMVPPVEALRTDG